MKAKGHRNYYLGEESWLLASVNVLQSPRRIFSYLLIYSFRISPVTLLWLFHSNFLTETLHFPTKVCFTFRITVSSTCGNRFESTCMNIGHVFDILTVLLHSCVKNCSYTVGVIFKCNRVFLLFLFVMS